MATADEVIVEFTAKVSGYERDVKRSAQTFEKATGAQQRQIKALESDIRRSSGQIGSTLRGLAGSFAAYFSVRELGAIADGFTRIQNSLKVAGLEGENLNATQEKLFQSAQRFGAEYESTVSLFSKGAQAQKSLGASQEELLKFTEATAASLKVQGQSAEQSRGALLQLGQAISGNMVQAEEYNSLIDGAYPLLQAAADGIERMGGNVATLTQEVKAGNVSSREFFYGILQGAPDLINRAESATLTLSQSFTQLNNALTEYVGGAASTSGASAGLAEGISLLADNIDTVIDAIVIISGALAVKFVASSAAATASSIALAGALTGTAAQMGIVGASSFALTARLAGAATSMEALAFASRGLLASLGGPVGIAIVAVTAGLGYLATRSDDAADALDNQGRAANDAAKFNEELQRILNQDPSRETAAGVRDLAAAHREAAKAAYEHAAAEIAAQYAQGARQASLAAQGKREVTETRRVKKPGAPSGGRGRQGDYTTVTETRIEAIPMRADGRYRGANPQEKLLNEGLNTMAEASGRLANLANTYESALESGPGGNSSAPAPAGANKATPSGRTGGASGQSRDDLDARAASDLRRFETQELQSRLELARTARDRAKIQARLLEIEREESQAQIDANKDLTDAQRASLQARQDNIYGTPPTSQGDIVAGIGLRQQQLIREQEAEAAREQAEIARSIADKQLAELDLRAENADTLAELRDIELQMVDVAFEAQRKAVEASDVSDAIKAARLAQLDAEQEIAKQRALDATAGPLEQYREQVRKTGADINTAIEGIQVEGLKGLNDGLTDAIMGTKTLGEAFSNVANQIISDLIRIAIQQAIIAPLMNALGGGGGATSVLAPGGGIGGGGGFFGSLIPGVGDLFGARAMGGPVSTGRPYMVGERGPELFVPGASGAIVPNTAMPKIAQQPRQTVVQQTVQIDARDSIASPDFVAWAKANAAESAATAGRVSYDQSMRDAPKAVQRANRYGR